MAPQRASNDSIAVTNQAIATTYPVGKESWAMYREFRHFQGYMSKAVRSMASKYESGIRIVGVCLFCGAVRTVHTLHGDR